MQDNAYNTWDRHYTWDQSAQPSSNILPHSQSYISASGFASDLLLFDDFVAFLDVVLPSLDDFFALPPFDFVMVAAYGSAEGDVVDSGAGGGV